MSLKEKIKESLSELLKNKPYELKESEILLEEPRNPEHGDYATNVALKLTKKLKKSPSIIAQEIIRDPGLNQGLGSNFEFTEINGFINIKITDQELYKESLNINENYGDLLLGNNQKVILEYVSANPTGPLHIGHGRWAAIGDTLARVLTKVGYNVHREFYLNDLGNQIENFHKSIEAVKNNQPIPEDGYHGAYIQELAQLDSDPVQTMIKQQKETLKNARVEFDEWFSESSLANQIDDILEFLKKHNLTYEKEGAIWFKSEKFGDDKDRVLVKSDGSKTYFLSDILYHKNKLERGFETLINIWGADHHGYVKRVEAAIKALEKETGNTDAEFKTIIGQLVSLYRDGQPVKLSKRTGEIITLNEVVEEIGADATRYFLARYSFDTPLDFDLSLAVKKSNDNPVYYVQYAHARICSILRQDEVKSIKLKPKFTNLEPSERALILKLVRFPDELETISQNYTIHRLCSYAEELAKMFHLFYHECRVISGDEQTTANRLAIIKAVKTVIKIVLELLGVSAPEKM